MPEHGYYRDQNRGSAWVVCPRCGQSYGSYHYCPATAFSETSHKAEADRLRAERDEARKEYHRTRSDLLIERQTSESLRAALREIAEGGGGNDVAPIFSRLRGIARAALDPEGEG